MCMQHHPLSPHTTSYPILLHRAHTYPIYPTHTHPYTASSPWLPRRPPLRPLRRRRKCYCAGGLSLPSPSPSSVLSHGHRAVLYVGCACCCCTRARTHTFSHTRMRAGVEWGTRRDALVHHLGIHISTHAHMATVPAHVCMCVCVWVSWWRADKLHNTGLHTGGRALHSQSHPHTRARALVIHCTLTDARRCPSALCPALPCPFSDQLRLQ